MVIKPLFAHETPLRVWKTRIYWSNFRLMQHWTTNGPGVKPTDNSYIQHVIYRKEWTGKLESEKVTHIPLFGLQSISPPLIWYSCCHDCSPFTQFATFCDHVWERSSWARRYTRYLKVDVILMRGSSMRNGELLSTFVFPGGGQRRILLERDMPIVMSASRGHLSVDAYFVSCITLMSGW